MDRRALATLFLAAPPTFAAILYLYLRTSPASTATYNLTATPAHHVSYAQSLLNPRRFLTEQDSLTLVLPTRQHPSLKTLNDEEILARFTRGFHGGWAFWIERRFFQASGWSITRLAALNEGNPIGPAVWSPSQISRTTVPSLGSMLFGNFLVLDSSAAEAAARAELLPGSGGFARPEEGAFVEIAFGSDASRFAGSHRFEVWREEGKGREDDDAGAVGVRFSQVRMNPIVEGQFITKWLNGFHEVYAKCLFANGITEVLRN